MIDYKLIERTHGVSNAIFLDHEGRRRLREVREYHYKSKIVSALQRVLTRKSEMNDTEQQTLAEFPEHGIDLGLWANNFIFSPELAKLPHKTHVAMVSLVNQGCLGVVCGQRDGKTVEILVRPA